MKKQGKFPNPPGWMSRCGGPGEDPKKTIEILFVLDIPFPDGNYFPMVRTCIRNEKQDQLANHCRRHSIPLTHQRRIIMDELARRDDHPTPEDLYRAVVERIPGISRTTVYRVLETFEQSGLITRVVTPDAVARFDAQTGPHIHGVCIRCRRVLDLPAPPIDGIRLEPDSLSGFTPSKISIVVIGTCPSCSGNTPPPPPEGDIIPREGEES